MLKELIAQKEVLDNVYLTQEDKRVVCDYIQRYGNVYKKSAQILARRAKRGDKVLTITIDGLESINYADGGEYIVKNSTTAGEQYLVKNENFAYSLVESGQPWSTYIKDTKIYALELTKDLLAQLQLPMTFNIRPEWSTKSSPCTQIIKAGDYLASPENQSEFYRIQKDSFSETYKQV